MSPVFRHGRLRLYLLKLLDESPRHGYEVIRLLQDRFMGIYAPSPGTIYPRLARLEEDGLVTHEEVDGKKVYSITDKGREEIRNRLGDLADLEDELTESLRDVAREISEDVRDTVRTIREELASAAREFRADPSRAGAGRAGAGRAGASRAGAGRSGEAAEDETGSKAGTRAGSDAGAPGRPSADAAYDGGSADAGDAADDRAADDRAADDRAADDRATESESQRIRDEARRRREQMRASFRAQGRGHSDWAAWQGLGGRSEGSPWGSWTDWIGEPGSTGGSGEGRAGAGKGFAPAGGQRSRRGGSSPFSDLERMAMQFATELRSAAKQAGDIGERSLSDLRDILTDTLAKVRVEVFSDADAGGPTEQSGEASTEPGSPDDAQTEAAGEKTGHDAGSEERGDSSAAGGTSS